MLQKDINHTYIAIHFFVAGRQRHPNVAIYTDENNQWVLGLRNEVNIDPRKYPDEAEEADDARAQLQQAFANLNQEDGAPTVWGAIPLNLQKRFQRADAADFAENYLWYFLNVAPDNIDAVVGAGFPVD
ncbi:MAG: hypothetical protein FJW30_29685 [Acidobacteria bacterium]|nr:hypothetical protein [Acidobacteriota bacterium]MBM3843878.1 hypothetical protein [Verrucomicrobiota bacterium]